MEKIGAVEEVAKIGQMSGDMLVWLNITSGIDGPVPSK